HACAVADALGMRTVLVPPMAGVLSALGMGLADVTTMREQSVGEYLDDGVVGRLRAVAAALEAAAGTELAAARGRTVVTRTHRGRYDGTDTSLQVRLADPASMRSGFEAAHRRLYSFLLDRRLVVEAVSVEVVARSGAPDPSGPSAAPPTG